MSFKRVGIHLAGTVVLVAALIPLAPGSAGASGTQRVQTVTELTAKANQIAVDLDRLATKSSMLDESYNQAQIDLAALGDQTAGNQAELDSAEAILRSSTKRAKRYAIDAYVNGAAIDPVLMTSQSVSGASRRKVFVSVLQGDQQKVADDVAASQQTLQDRRHALDVSKAAAAKRKQQLADTKRRLEQTVVDQRRLQDSIKGDLARAVTDEQARLESQRAKDAAAEADSQRNLAAAAAREAATRIASPLAGRTSVSSSTTSSIPAATTSAGTDTNSETDLSQTGDTAATGPSLPISYATPGPIPANIQTVIDAAKSQLGVPYRWGASSPGSGFDCSGLILYAYAQIGISLPHSSRALHSMTQRISVDQLQPGDLIFGGNPVHHVGLYIGGGQQINAPHTGDVVKISPIYYVTPVSFGRL